MAHFNISPNSYYQLVDINSGDVITMWGDSTGGIAFRINMGEAHHLDDDTVLQQKVLGSILAYWKNNRKDSIGRGVELIRDITK